MIRVKTGSVTLVTLILISLISCNSNEENPEIYARDYYGDGSFFISLAKLGSPQISADHCGLPKAYELRLNHNLLEFGTVTVFRDGQYLNLQFDLILERINDGWKAIYTYVWVGLSKDWIEGRDGPEGGWRSVEGIDIRHFPTSPTSAIHKIRLEDWMFNECFIVAARVLTRNPDGKESSSNSFINNGEFLTYSWNEPFCLEKCDDPGTLSVSYWENNPSVWTKGVTVGGVFYSEELAIQIMKGITTSDDMSNVLFEELVSAKLNVFLGNTAYCIVDAIEAADAWMEENGPVGSGILSNNPAWDTGNSLSNQLESYNNGLLCADPAN
jgi:hypothetical protein